MGLDRKIVVGADFGRDHSGELWPYLRFASQSSSSRQGRSSSAVVTEDEWSQQCCSNYHFRPIIDMNTELARTVSDVKSQSVYVWGEPCV